MLCSPCIYELFNKITNSNVRSINDINMLFSEELKKIIYDLKIAKIVLNNSETLNIEYTDEDKISFSFESIDNKSCIIDIWPVKGYKWNDDEFKDLEFLINIFYLLRQKYIMTDEIMKAKLTDAMTNILNENGIKAHLGMIYARNMLSQFNFWFVNIKNFKIINQRFTPRGGDIVLNAFAKYISEIANAPFEKAARMGKRTVCINL